NPKNKSLVIEALKKAGRTDLIGTGKNCLVNAPQGERNGSKGRQNNKKGNNKNNRNNYSKHRKNHNKGRR
ncbi:MAG: DUF3362 domain-containing protein, partial [Ruminococcus sp.]